MKPYKLIVKPVTRTRSSGGNRAREMNLWDLYGRTALSSGLHTRTHIVQDRITAVKLRVALQYAANVLWSNWTSPHRSIQRENEK